MAWILFALLILLSPKSASTQETEGPLRVELPDETEEIKSPKETPPPLASKLDPTPYSSAPSTPPPFHAGPPAYRAAPARPPARQRPAPTRAPDKTGSTPPTAPKQPTLMDEPEEEKAEKEEIFPVFTMAPELGYLFFPRSEMVVNGFKATVETRNGFIVKLHFDIGGDGLAFEISPMFAIEAGGITREEVEFTSALSSGSFKAVGGQTALAYRFDVGRFFPSIGLGFHGNYLMGNEIDYGTELYGRIPVGFTVYMGKKIGLVVETGFMYGVTGIKVRPKLPAAMDSLDPTTRAELENSQTPEDFEAWYNQHQDEIDQWIRERQEQGDLPEEYDNKQMAADFAQDQLAETIRFGRGFGMDIMIGLRFP